MSSPQEISLTQWVARLRDPSSLQTRCHLREAGTRAMCCLGHLGDLIDPDGWRSNYWRGARANLGVHRPSWMSRRQLFDAIHLNDHQRLSLAEIADWAEAGIPEIEVWLDDSVVPA